MINQEWSQIQGHILQFEQDGLVTRTFRRLDSDRQQSVIQAILEEASEKGPSSINIKEVARRADVSIGSLYQYFGNRDGLLNFAVALCVRYMIDMFDQFGPMLSAMPLREALRYYVLGGIEWGQIEKGLVQFFGRAAYQGDPIMTELVVKPVADVMSATMKQILTGALARREIRSNINLDAVGRAINTLMIAGGDSQIFPYLNTYYQFSDDEMPFEQVVDAMIEMILNGIG